MNSSEKESIPELKQPELWRNDKAPLVAGFSITGGLYKGVKIGTDLNLIRYKRIKKSRFSTRRIDRVLFVQPSLNYLFDQDFIALLINTEFGWRKHWRGISFSELNVGLGWLFQQRDKAIARDRTGAQYKNFMHSISSTYGIMFHKKSYSSLYIKAGIWFPSIKRSFSRMHPSIEAGIRITPQWSFSNPYTKHHLPETKGDSSVLWQENFAPWTISYYSNMLLNTGIKIGFDWNIKLLTRERTKQWGTKTIRKLWFCHPSIAYVNDKPNYHALLLNTELGRRHYTKRMRYYWEGSLGLGYQIRMNPGETWKVDDNGNVKKTIGMRGYFVPSVAFSFGKQLKTTIPSWIFCKLHTAIITGFNSYAVPEFNFEVGLRFAPSWGIKNPFTITKTKKKS